MFSPLTFLGEVLAWVPLNVQHGVPDLSKALDSRRFLVVRCHGVQLVFVDAPGLDLSLDASWLFSPLGKSQLNSDS